MKQGLLFAAVFCIVVLNGDDLLDRTKKHAKEANTPAAPPIDLSQLKFPVIKKVLPNGLTILLQEDHSTPQVSYQTWFKVGSRNEEPGFTGIAHLFEHMMFKGAKRFSGKDFDKVLQSNGITNNAFTTQDFTAYYEDLPSDKLRLVMDVESDRMVNLNLTEENLKSERDVVKEERRMRVENSHFGAMYESFWSTAFEIHPYKWPVIGWMKDLDNINLERCKAFYHTYYSPTNAVLTIVGDINPEQTLAMINEFYGPLQKVDVPAPKITPEPQQKKERTTIVRRLSQDEQILFGYHISKAGDDDSFAMDLISNITTEGSSSRAYKKLVHLDQVAVSTSGSSITNKDPGVFIVHVELKPQFKASRVLGLAVYEIEQLGRHPVAKDELEKAKNQIMKKWVDNMKTVHGKAMALAMNEVVTGSYENMFNDLERYQKVTREDIQKVAAKYLNPGNRTVVTLIPEKGSKR